jgi:hypothetical protein
VRLHALALYTLDAFRGRRKADPIAAPPMRSDPDAMRV